MASSNGRSNNSGTRSRSGSNRTGTGKTNNSSRNTRSNGAGTRGRDAAPMDVAIRNEIVLILLIALCLCLFLCNILNFGPIGDAISGVMFGCVGLIAYILPIILFLSVAFFMSNVGNQIATRKLVAAITICVLFTVFCELFVGNYTEDSSFILKEIYDRCKETKAGGGILGGAIAFCFIHFIGKVGAILVSLVIAIICFIVVTDKSFIKGVSKQGKKMYERSKEDAIYRRERMEEKRLRQEEERLLTEQKRQERASRMKEMKREKMEAKENEKILRMDKHVTGVMLDTALSQNTEDVKPVKERDDIHQIMLDDSVLPQEPEIRFSADSTFSGYDYMVDPAHAKQEIHAISLSDIPAEETASPKTNTVYPKSERVQSKEKAVVSEKEEVLSQEDYRVPLSEVHRIRDMEPVAVEPAVKGTLPKAVVPTVHKDGKQYGAHGMTESVSPLMQHEVSTADKEEDKRGTAAGTAPMAPKPPAKPKKYIFPSTNLLKPVKRNNSGDSERELRDTAARLQQTLASFGVKATITDISQGPSVTRYELQPEQGVKVSKIVGLQDDIKLNLAATDIRIEAPIPGKAAVGIEVPNKENAAVSLRELLEAKEYKDFHANLAFAVGKDIGGQVVVTDIAKMPHMLIAGSTGSGKSVCINTIIMSILFKASPEDVKLIMVDPKVVELSVYNHIPHLLMPVVTDPKKAANALHWGVVEMTERYKKFADFNVRDLKGYNEKVDRMHENGDPGAPEKMPQILIIVDELADLMMVAPGEVEESICRLAQLARAAGIHLIIATQRPSVDVITGLIKANMPSRVAFAVSSGVDSRTILDMNGAEKLLGKGDMLFYPQGYPKPARIQGAFVSDQEVSAVVDFIRNQNYVCTGMDSNIEELVNNMSSQSGNGGSGSTAEDSSSDLDQYFVDAGRIIIEKEKASIGMLQRVFKIGFNRAARIMDQLCEAGVVGEEEGTKPRKILMTMEQFEEMIGE